MTRQEKIRILKSDSYSQSYFKHAPSRRNGSSSDAGPYFEINRRCIWKNTIGPHRLDFYMVFLVTKGEGIHRFGIEEHYVKKNMLCFIGPDMISSWESQSDDHQGFFCAFSEDFFNLGRIDKFFLNELPFFRIDGTPVLSLTPQQTQYYLSLFEFMYDECESTSEYSGNILRSLLHAILHKAYSQFHVMGCKPVESNPSGLRLLKAFTSLYMHDFKNLVNGKSIQLKKVSGYAEALGVSQNHLNDTVKNVTGRSAGQLIKNQLMKHATMCLLHSSKSIGEIAYALGFEDPSYFARFYKTHSGKSPSDLRSI